MTPRAQTFSEDLCTVRSRIPMPVGVDAPRQDMMATCGYVRQGMRASRRLIAESGLPF